jgi:hypothetical protein
LALFWIIQRRQQAHAVISESKWSATLRHVIDGLHLMGNPRTLGATTAISLLYMVCQFASLWALMKAYEMDLSFWSAAGVVTIIRLWTVVPSAPANLGLLNAACFAALRGLDVEPAVAQTFSIIMFAAWTLPLVVCGAIATALTGSNIGELHKRPSRRSGGASWTGRIGAWGVRHVLAFRKGHEAIRSRTGCRGGRHRRRSGPDEG